MEAIAFEIGHFHIFDICDFDLDLDPGLSYTAYRRVSLIDRYPHIKFRSNRKNFAQTDVRTGGRTLRRTLSGRYGTVNVITQKSIT